MLQVRAGTVAAALALVVAAVGCSDDRTCTGSACEQVAASDPPGSRGADPARRGATSFESDLVDSKRAPRGPASGTAAPTSGTAAPASAPAPNGDSAERAIGEADVIQVQGDRLYALSRTSGLAIIDISQPSALKLLGRYRDLPATPFELYLRGDVALVMFSAWGGYFTDGTNRVWGTTSKLLALDVADAANIQPVGSFDVPGAISDSRTVGDILYVVSRQDGACFRCAQNRQLVSITSLNVGNPRDVTKVDELAYDDGNVGWGPRSVSVTEQRLYVSGPRFGTDAPTESTIQLVDISDPAGDLVEGTSVQVAGQVQSRWQMDEYEGVLRVVSQPWLGRNASDTRPVVQTFRVESANKLSALGRTELQLPAQETLRSVRFDGARAYAITAKQQDPLFALDLSDPAKPRQVGELHLPGFITHMEPQGERLLGLGMDRDNPEGAIAVSLFDVKDLHAPKLLSRVSFGGRWGQVSSDQDRLHKVFRVLSDAGLVLVPFNAWKEVELPGTCPTSESTGGVQLIELQDDVLRARGVAKSAGETRRALLARGQLIIVGDEHVQAFDLTDRDAPAELSKIVLSRYARSVRELANGAAVRFDVHGTMHFDLVDKRDVSDANQSLAFLDLSREISGTLDHCSPGMALRGSFVHGNRIEVLYAGWSFVGGEVKHSKQGLVIVDASDPSAPRMVSNTVWSTGDVVWTPSAGLIDYGEIFELGRVAEAVETADTIAVLEHFWPDASSNAPHQIRLRVIDVRDPANVTTTTVPLTSDAQYSGLIVADNVVMTSHFEKTSGGGAHGRFYLDRVDISDPSAPVSLGKVNVPGALVAFDVSSRRALTSQLVRKSVPNLSSEACRTRFALAEWQMDAGEGQCTGYVQHLQLVRIDGDEATLVSEHALPESLQASSISPGDGVLFALTTHAPNEAPRRTSEGVWQRELFVLGGFDEDELEVGQITIDSDESRWIGPYNVSNLHAAGKRALVLGAREAAIIDAADVSHPSLHRRVSLIGTAQGVDLYEKGVLLSAGDLGVQVIDFD